VNTIDPTSLIDKEFFDKDFEAKVAESQSISSQARQKRLSTASKIPERVPVVSTAFRRNPDVVAEVLARANGTVKNASCQPRFFEQGIIPPSWRYTTR